MIRDWFDIKVKGITALLVIWWCIIFFMVEDRLPSSISGWLIIGVIKIFVGFIFMGWIFFAWFLVLIGLNMVRFALISTFMEKSRTFNPYEDLMHRTTLIVGLISNLYILMNLSFGRDSFTLLENYTICLPYTLLS